MLGRLDEFSKTTYVSPFFKSFVFVGLGDRDHVFRELEKVLDERHPSGAVSLKINPLFDSLRSDPRYTKLLERAGFTQ